MTSTLKLSPTAPGQWVVSNIQHTVTGGQSPFRPPTPGVGVYEAAPGCGTVSRLSLVIILEFYRRGGGRRRKQASTGSQQCIYFTGEQCQLWAVQVGCTVCVYTVKNQVFYPHPLSSCDAFYLLILRHNRHLNTKWPWTLLNTEVG